MDRVSGYTRKSTTLPNSAETAQEKRAQLKTQQPSQLPKLKAPRAPNSPENVKVEKVKNQSKRPESVSSEPAMPALPQMPPIGSAAPEVTPIAPPQQKESLAPLMQKIKDGDLDGLNALCLWRRRLSIG